MKLEGKKAIWKDYQKEIAGDRYYYVRSCVRQNFFPGSETTFLRIMREVPAFPVQLRWMQRLLVRAAVDILPAWMRECLGVTAQYGLRPGERMIVRLAGAVSDRIILPAGPAAQSCLRLGLPITYLHG